MPFIVGSFGMADVAKAEWYWTRAGSAATVNLRFTEHCVWIVYLVWLRTSLGCVSLQGCVFFLLPPVFVLLIQLEWYPYHLLPACIRKSLREIPKINILRYECIEGINFSIQRDSSIIVCLQASYFLLGLWSIQHASSILWVQKMSPLPWYLIGY